jgi:hypothetical protein
MDGLENKYLRKVNLRALQKETGMNLVELAELAEIGPKVIYKWAYMHKDSSRPSYNALVKLFERGASVETLFGVEYKRPSENSNKENLKITDEDLSRALFRAAEMLGKNKADKEKLV